MEMTARELNRSTLGRQMLLQREPLGLEDAVCRVVAIQAQHPASPYLALWNRIDDFDPAELDAAFNNLTVVKATMMRITLHAALADDYPIFREATEPTILAARLRDRRFKASGLSEEDAATLVPALLTAAETPQSAAELSAWLETQLGEAAPKGAWWGMRQYAPLLRAPTGETWSFGAGISYIAPRIVPVLDNPEVATASLQTLILRYLSGFGPASVADIAQFTLVQRTRVREALAGLAAETVQLVGPSGEELFDIPGGQLLDEETPAPPRLLGMWDNILLAYFVRDRIIPPEYRQIVIRRNGDVLPTLLVDGYVAGIWRATDQGIEATAFHDLPDDVWAALAEEAQQLATFLADRDPQVYARYGHWWDKLPDFETRVLASP